MSENGHDTVHGRNDDGEADGEILVELKRTDEGVSFSVYREGDREWVVDEEAWWTDDELDAVDGNTVLFSELLSATVE